jgi:hypothetical protein
MRVKKIGFSRMLLLTSTTILILGLSMLRNLAFITLNCGALWALIYFSLKGGEVALSWLLWPSLVALTLFAVSLSHLKHQMLALKADSQFSGSIGGPLENAVHQCGEAGLKVCLVAAGVFIVLQAWRLRVLFARTRVADSALIVVRFFVGALFCAGILGVGLLAHRSSAGGAAKSEQGDVKKGTNGI